MQDGMPPHMPMRPSPSPHDLHQQGNKTHTSIPLLAPQAHIPAAPLQPTHATAADRLDLCHPAAYSHMFYGLNDYVLPIQNRMSGFSTSCTFDQDSQAAQQILEENQINLYDNFNGFKSQLHTSESSHKLIFLPNSLKSKQQSTNLTYDRNEKTLRLHRNISSSEDFPTLSNGLISSAAFSTAPTIEHYSPLQWQDPLYYKALSDVHSFFGISTVQSTSVYSVPVSFTSANHQNVISYYSENACRDLFSVPNNLPHQKTSHVAATILREPHNFNMKLNNERNLTSPFLNISNYHRQQPSPFQPTKSLHYGPGSHQPLYISATCHGADSQVFKVPVDNRPKHSLYRTKKLPFLKGGTLKDCSTSHFLPPNVVLNERSSKSKRNLTMQTRDFHSNELVNVAGNQRTTQNDARKEKMTHTNAESQKISQNAASHNISMLTDKNNVLVEKKQSEKPRRKSLSSLDPKLDTLVDAKVQEIMAACRKRELENCNGVNQSSQQHLNQSTSSLPKTSHGWIKHFENEIQKAEVKVMENSYNNLNPFMKNSSIDNNIELNFSNDSFAYEPARELCDQVMDVRLAKKQRVQRSNSRDGQMSAPLYAKNLMENNFKKFSVEREEIVNDLPSQEHVNKVQCCKNDFQNCDVQDTKSRSDHCKTSVYEQISEVKSKEHQHTNSPGLNYTNIIPLSHQYHSSQGLNMLHRKHEHHISQFSDKKLFGENLQCNYSVNANDLIKFSNNVILDGGQNTYNNNSTSEKIEESKTKQPNQWDQHVLEEERKVNDTYFSENTQFFGKYARLGIELSENCPNLSKNQECKLQDNLDFKNNISINSCTLKDPYKFPDDGLDNKPLIQTQLILGIQRKQAENISGKHRKQAENISLGHNKVFKCERKHDHKLSEPAVNHFVNTLERKASMQHIPSKTIYKHVEQKTNHHCAVEVEKIVTKNKLNTVGLAQSQRDSFTKKPMNIPFDIKSAMSLLKRSFKYKQKKTCQPNGKFKKKPKDDLAEKILNNFVVLPLKLQELETKRWCQLRNSCVNTHSTIPGNVTAESKPEHLESLLSIDNILSSKLLPYSSAASQTSEQPFAEVPTIMSTICGQNTSIQNTPRPLTLKEIENTFHTEMKIENTIDKEISHSVNDQNEQYTLTSNEEQKEYKDLNYIADPNASFPDRKDKFHIMTEQISKLQQQVMEKNCLLETNTLTDVPRCGCLGPEAVHHRSIEGPYYTQLGVARSVEAVRKLLEDRMKVTGKAIRIEKICYTGKEGKSSQGCPIAKWIIRRSSLDEKILALVRHRTGHFCEYSWIIVALVAWEGVPTTEADDLYEFLCHTLPKYGHETERRCSTNGRKTCACQGADLMKRGASFSFGCSWSMYFNGCKYARSLHARKFKLKNEAQEEVLEDKLQDLATNMARLHQQIVPEANYNQCYFSARSQDCRLGKESGGPFSGVTACVDFCAHAHKDIHNMNNGSTVVVTLTKHRSLSKPDDEQLHVLPLYVLDPTDEQGNSCGQFEKIRSGSLEILHQYPLEARMRSHPVMTCKKRRDAKRKLLKKVLVNGQYHLEKKDLLQLHSPNSNPQTTSLSRPHNSNRQVPNLLISNIGANSGSNMDYNNINRPVCTNRSVSCETRSRIDTKVNNKNLQSRKSVSGEDLTISSAQTGFIKDCWDYFYTFGIFPPPSVLSANLDSRKQNNFNVNTHEIINDERSHVYQNRQWNNCNVPMGTGKHSCSTLKVDCPVSSIAPVPAAIDNIHFILPEVQCTNAHHVSQLPQELDCSLKSCVSGHVRQPSLVTVQSSCELADDTYNHIDIKHTDQPHHQHAAGYHSHLNKFSLPGNTALDLSLSSSSSKLYDSKMSVNISHEQHHDNIFDTKAKSDTGTQQQHCQSVLGWDHISRNGAVFYHYQSPLDLHSQTAHIRRDKGLKHVDNNSSINSYSSQFGLSATTHKRLYGPNTELNHVSINRKLGKANDSQLKEYQHCIPQDNMYNGGLCDWNKQFPSILSNETSEYVSSQSSANSPVDTSKGRTIAAIPSMDSSKCGSVSAKSVLDTSKGLTHLNQSDTHLPHLSQSDTHAPQLSEPDTHVPHLNQPDTHLSHMQNTQPHVQNKHIGTHLPHVQNKHTGTYLPHVQNKHTDTHLPHVQNIKSNSFDDQAQLNADQHMWNQHYDHNKLVSHEKLNSLDPEKVNSEPSVPDPDVIKCEMEYNEAAFHDPNIGGVAVALCHGSVLFEVAKHELHATTGLRNPNRYKPTRISLVFYQHKRLNNKRHGMHVYEKKLEDMKMQRIEKMKLERGYVDMEEIENSFKVGKKHKINDVKSPNEGITELIKGSEAPYQYMRDGNTKHVETMTTATVCMKQIIPAPKVTGPYQKWV